MKTVIQVGAAPPEFTGTATFFDGTNGTPQSVTYTADDSTGTLRIDHADTTLAEWPVAKLRSVPDQAGGDQLILTNSATPGGRLILTDHTALGGLTARAPGLHRRTAHVSRGRLAAWAVAALASVALIVFLLVPALSDRLATFLPPEGEVALGDTTFDQVRRAFDRTGVNPIPVCTGSDGTQALATLMDTLTKDIDLPHPVRLAVLDHPLVNAFALPGGRVILFRGLIEAAESPDEVAAVMAHELGHLVARDPTRSALRTVGTLGIVGLLFGDFAGGSAVLLLTNRLINASYSQEAEAAADSFAHARLNANGISPDAIGTFFDRLLAEYGDQDALVAPFMSHPAMADRIASARAAAAAGGPYGPAMEEGAWRAVQTICDTTGPTTPIAPTDGV